PNVGNWWLEIQVPVRFNKKLDGIAGPVTHQLQVVTTSVHGVAVPVQPVTVFYRAAFESLLTSAVTGTAANLSFTLDSYYHSGTLFIDTGTVNPPLASGSGTAIANSALSFPINSALSGLTAATTYYWRARYVTSDGMFTSTPTQVFTTVGGGGGTQPLTVSRSGTGSGSVASNPGGIDCGAACSANFTSGITVMLTAAPASGSTFAGWGGGGCSGNRARLLCLSTVP